MNRIAQYRDGLIGVISLFLLNLTSAQASTAPGKIIQLPHTQLHAIQTNGNSYNLLLFHGAGDNSLVWLPLLKQMPNVKAIAFDDPGHGWSRYGNLNATIRQKAFDVGLALDELKRSDPFIVVGHSYGGLTALEFAKQFPDLTTAVVLIDSSHPDMMLRYRQTDGTFKWQKTRDRAKGFDIPAPIAGNNSYQQSQSFRPNYGFRSHENFSDIEKTWLDSLENTYVIVPKGLKTYAGDELKNMYQQFESYHLGNKPLMVIAAGQVSKTPDDIWSNEMLVAEKYRLSKDLTRLSNNSKYHVEPSAGHRVFLDEPEKTARRILQWIESIK